MLPGPRVRRQFLRLSASRRKPTRSCGRVRTRSGARSDSSARATLPFSAKCGREKTRSEGSCAMRRGLVIALAVVVLLVAGGAALVYTAAGRFLIIGTIVQFTKPNHGWDLAYKAKAPDYSSPEAWAALPGHPSNANFAPAGTSTASDAQVDVFFIHPTGYMKDYDWNSP